MEQVKAGRCLLSQVRVYMGPELISGTFPDWCEEHGIKIICIQKGKPQQNGFAEHFNDPFRFELLYALQFESLS